MPGSHLLATEHTRPRQRARPAVEPATEARHWPRRILVAVDGTAPTDPAPRAAYELERRTGASVHVAAIYAPRIPVPACADRPGLDACERGDRPEAAHFVATVRTRLRDMFPDRRDRAAWAFRVEVGDPGAALVRLAAETKSDLVIVGLAQREPLDWRANGRTAICAARHRFARLHSGLTDTMPIADAVRRTCGPGIDDALSQLTFERADVGSDMLGGILHLASELAVQMIAVPNHGDPGAVRSFLPNLAELLLPSAKCSVLVVPDETSVTA